MQETATQEQKNKFEPAKIREIKERLKLAEEMGLTNQVRLLTQGLVNALRLHVLEQAGTYPEVTRNEAREAFCKPFTRLFFGECSWARCVRRLPHVERVYKYELWRERVEIASNVVIERGTEIKPRAGAVVEADRDEIPSMMSGLINPQMFANLFGGQGRTDSVELPMAALCRLKEARDKNLFDAYEVWRPVSKAEAERLADPWLVGLIGERFFKLCDWR